MKNDKWIVQLPQWGRHLVQVRSIGHKWVYYKKPKAKCFKRMSRAVWDEVCIRTLEEDQYRLDILNAFKRMGFDFHKPCRVVKSHPVKKYGYENKTFEDIEAEVLAELENSKQSKGENNEKNR